MTRYKGTVTVHDEPNFGFIGLNTVTHADGRSASLSTKRDIFVHKNDVDDSELKVGLEIIFQVNNDDKRGEGLRARHAIAAVATTIENGLEIHIEEVIIDHPLVPIRWCIKAETLKRMEAAPDRQWALFLIAQTVSDTGSPERFALKPVIGVRDIGLNRAYFPFPASGEYSLVGYLISSDLKPDRQQHLYKEMESYNKRNPVWDMTENEINLGVAEWTDDPVIIEATVHVPVSVPAGIFAKPLPRWARTWLGYFGLERPADECSSRGRIGLAFTLGLAWFLFWETLKRSYMLILGVVHFIFGGSPLPLWKEACAPQLSALFSGFTGKYEYERLTSYRGWRKFCHPAIWILLCTLAGIFIVFPRIREFMEFMLGFVAVAIFVIILLYNFLVRYFDKQEESREERERAEAAKAAEETARQLANIRAYAVCGIGMEPQKAPASIKLVFTGIKRRVCRAYE